MSAVRTWRAGHGNADEDNDNIGIHSAYHIKSTWIFLVGLLCQINEQIWLDFPCCSFPLSDREIGYGWFRAQRRYSCDVPLSMLRGYIQSGEECHINLHHGYLPCLFGPDLVRWASDERQ